MTAKRILFLLLFVAVTAAAQETSPTPPTTLPAPPPVIANADSADTREQLHQVLSRLPPQVAKTLKLDPTLWTNPAYLANYPTLASFVATHPEVPHSPAYYLENVWIPGDPSPETGGHRIWNRLIETISIFCGFGLLAGVFIWLVKTVVDHHRWNRASRLQAEVHNKLLDRFAGNDDLLKYINTPAGRHYLESTPIALDAGPRELAAPVGRVLWSVQAGIVLAAAGVGLKLVSWSMVDKDVSLPLSAMGVLGVTIGIGFIIAAAVSFALSRRLGLWQPPEPRTAAGEP